MSIWDNCSTHGCRNKRRHPAAVCDTCLTELYGYGKDKKLGENGRLVEPVKTMTHLPKMPSASQSPQQSFETEMRMKIAELTERTLLAERAFKSYRQQPLDTVPEEFRDLQPFTAEADIPAGAIQCVEVKPFNAQVGKPRYCRIRAHDHLDAGVVRHLRLGSVEISYCSQMQISDRGCRHYVDTSFYALQYGAPVDWGIISYQYLLNLYLMNPHMVQVKVQIEIWCDTRISHQSAFYHIPPPCPPYKL